MKKILIAATVSCSTLLLQAQNNKTEMQTDTAEIEMDSVSIESMKLPDSTGIGAADGKSVSKEIGPAGGKIISDDGRVELIFPESALKVNTTISVQPIINLIPNGNGKAYRFEPSGVQFEKPVQVIFHYTDKEAGICPPELKFMAIQDGNGKWEYLNYDDWDSTAKTLKGSISHFSAFLDGNRMELSIVDTTLKVGKRFGLHLIVVTPPVVVAPGEDELPNLPPAAPNIQSRRIIWSVEGGQRYGTVRRLTNQYKATYTAPNHLPGSDAKVVLKINEVTVRKVVQRSGKWRGTTRIPETKNLAEFTCNVKFYDEYKVTVGQDFKVDGGRMTDTSIFRLRIGIEERASISGIDNQLAKVQFRQSRCIARYVNAATCVGMINVVGIKTSTIVPPASPNGFVRVNVFFKPAPFVFPVIHFPPCGGNRASNITPTVAFQNAFPMWLNFEAKNEKQYISLGTGAVVRRPDPEDITATIEPIREQ